jgi:hypothetical protein
MGRIDFIELNDTLQEVYIKDDLGCYVMYDCVMQDLKSMEDYLTKVGSFYIHKSEVLLDPKTRPYPVRDRHDVAYDLLTKEATF